MQGKKLWMLLFLLVYGFGALSTTQTIPFLKDAGLNELQKGFILASIAIFTVLMQVLFGILSDKTGKMKPFFVVVFLLASIVSVLMYFSENSSFWMLLIMMGFVGGACRTYQSMLDTWSLQTDTENQSFEKNKALGSVGWAIGAWAGAIICAAMSWKMLALLSGVVSFVLFLLVRKAEDTQRESTMKCSQIKELIHNQEYVILVLIMLVLFAMGCADIYLVVDKILALQGTSFHIGLKWGIQSLVEAPAFLWCDRLLKRFKMIHLLVFSTLMFGVRFLVYSFTQNVWLLVTESLFQSVTFPIAVYCTKIGIDKCTSSEIKSTGQLFGASIYMGVSLLVMPLLMQFLSWLFGQDGALMVVAGFSLVALYFIHLYRKIIS